MKIWSIVEVAIILTGMIFMANYSLNHVSERDSYSWTTAICDSVNNCADYYVNCNGNEVVSSSRVTGMISFGPAWTDPRGGNQPLCPR